METITSSATHLLAIVNDIIIVQVCCEVISLCVLDGDHH